MKIRAEASPTEESRRWREKTARPGLCGGRRVTGVPTTRCFEIFSFAEMPPSKHGENLAMVYSPHPPDCTEIIERDIIPDILKRIKYWCVSGAVFIILPGIHASFGMPKYIFLPLLIITFVSIGYWSWSLRKFQCPNCEKSIYTLSISMPKKCSYCLAKFKA